MGDSGGPMYTRELVNGKELAFQGSILNHESFKESSKEDRGHKRGQKDKPQALNEREISYIFTSI